MTDQRLALAQRLWRHVDRSGECWAWTRCTGSHGYGHVRIAGRVWLTHRLAYALSRGNLPHGLILDHLCRNRLCCRPSHLEAVTHRVNILRGNGACAQHARKTHCKRGHELSGANLYRMKDGGRRCRSCHRASNAASEQRVRARALEKTSLWP